MHHGKLLCENQSLKDNELFMEIPWLPWQPSLWESFLLLWQYQILSNSSLDVKIPMTDIQSVLVFQVFSCKMVILKIWYLIPQDKLWDSILLKNSKNNGTRKWQEDGRSLSIMNALVYITIWIKLQSDIGRDRLSNVIKHNMSSLTCRAECLVCKHPTRMTSQNYLALDLWHIY